MKTLMRSLVKISAVVCLVISMTTLASCKKTNEDLIVGTWRCTSATLNPDDFTEAERVVASYTSAKYLFTAEKYFAVADPTGTSYGYYTIDGDKLGIVIRGSEDAIMAQINHLDSKNLTFTFTQEVYDEDENGESLNIKVAVTMNLEKVKDAGKQ